MVVLTLGILCAKTFQLVCTGIGSHGDNPLGSGFVFCFSLSKVQFAEMVDKETNHFKFSTCQSEHEAQLLSSLKPK